MKLEDKVDDQRCPQCDSWEGLKFPRGQATYCEDCGWPDEDFAEDVDCVTSVQQGPL